MNARAEPRWVRPVCEYLPLAVFFAAYMLWDLYIATAALLAATVGALALSFAITRRVPMMPLVVAVLVGVFGGLTLALDDEVFIKIKPTIVQALMGAVLLGGLVFGKALLKPVFGPAFPPMSDAGWRKVTRNFGLFFFCMAALNELVWRTQSTDFWVSFKVFGIMGLMFVFLLTQLPVMFRHQPGRDAGHGGSASLAGRLKAAGESQAQRGQEAAAGRRRSWFSGRS